MARALPRSKANPQRIDSHDAYNRAQARYQDIVKDAEDPQPGPVENRSRSLKRKPRI